MKNYLHKLFLCRAKASAFITKIQFSVNVYKREKCRLTFLSGQLFLIAVFFLISIVKSNAQIAEKATFILNEYLMTDGVLPYPIVNESKLATIDTTKLTSVMNYGAKGDGKTFDDNAIK